MEQLMERPGTLDALAQDTAVVEARRQDPHLASVRIRHIQAADYPLMKAFVSGLSRDTAYKRLMSPRTPTDDELRRWTAIDNSRECALVALEGATDEERLIGVARYVMESDRDADFAIVLADAWQGRGLGRELLARLVAAARQSGVRQLSGVTLSTNVAMLTLARGLGFSTTRVAGIATSVSLELSSASSLPGVEKNT